MHATHSPLPTAGAPEAPGEGVEHGVAGRRHSPRRTAPRRAASAGAGAMACEVGGAGAGIACTGDARSLVHACVRVLREHRHNLSELGYLQDAIVADVMRGAEPNDLRRVTAAAAPYRDLTPLLRPHWEAALRRRFASAERELRAAAARECPRAIFDRLEAAERASVNAAGARLRERYAAIAAKATQHTTKMLPGVACVVKRRGKPPQYASTTDRGARRILPGGVVNRAPARSAASAGGATARMRIAKKVGKGTAVSAAKKAAPLKGKAMLDAARRQAQAVRGASPATLASSIKRAVAAPGARKQEHVLSKSLIAKAGFKKPAAETVTNASANGSGMGMMQSTGSAGHRASRSDPSTPKHPPVKAARKRLRLFEESITL